MSCKECEQIQDLAFNKNIAETTPIPYCRIGDSNLALVGCRKHVKEAIDKLNQTSKK